jgi:hypothetical protein
MFTASPAEIVIMSLAMGSVVAWLDSLTNPPQQDDETSWGRAPDKVTARQTLALPAPSVVLPQPVPVAQPAQVADPQPAPPPPKLATAALKSTAGNAARSGPKGRSNLQPKQPN